MVRMIWLSVEMTRSEGAVDAKKKDVAKFRHILLNNVLSRFLVVVVIVIPIHP